MYISIVWQYNKVNGRKAKYDEALIMTISSLKVCNYVSICSIQLWAKGGSYMSLTLGSFLHFQKIFIWYAFFLFKSSSFGLQLSWVFDYGFDFDLIFYGPSFDFLWFAGLELYFYGSFQFRA